MVAVHHQHVGPKQTSVSATPPLSRPAHSKTAVLSSTEEGMKVTFCGPFRVMLLVYCAS